MTITDGDSPTQGAQTGRPTAGQRLCDGCGREALVDDLFCTACGERLASTAALVADTDDGQDAAAGSVRTDRRVTLTRKQWAVVVGLLLTAALSSSALIAGLGAQSPPSSNVHISGTGRISH